jgi:hypothetical protein
MYPSWHAFIKQSIWNYMNFLDNGICLGSCPDDNGWNQIRTTNERNNMSWHVWGRQRVCALSGSGTREGPFTALKNHWQLVFLWLLWLLLCLSLFSNSNSNFIVKFHRPNQGYRIRLMDIEPVNKQIAYTVVCPIKR